MLFLKIIAGKKLHWKYSASQLIYLQYISIFFCWDYSQSRWFPEIDYNKIALSFTLAPNKM